MRYGLVFQLRCCSTLLVFLHPASITTSKTSIAPSKHAELTKVVTTIVEHSGSSYGYRRVWIQLKKLGIKVSEKVVC
ncbi:IS3 family transposase [Corynebacterium diphtheriae]|uniref:IS3 family transposase n=1 Tax=Corynebacterium diphtheriae TaxID=1717 RepID=UPI00272BFD3B|nr:IS3 family transposase [Corynebacterium diphtheriae]WLF42488.1 IS3 family transposase [Corynebacterium diphtheriae]